MIAPELSDVIERFFQGCGPQRLGVAVSGGGDSLALLHLLHDWGAVAEICAVTVDHRLRAASHDEAEQVARICDGLGIGHDILSWDDWDGAGNLQDQARRARIRLIGQWARDKAQSMVALGHTADDQAENLLLRLARQAGIDGLAAMQDRREMAGVTWVRPLLDVRRSQLRDYLRARGVKWLEDPSNEDPQYDRVKMRIALKTLEPLGITVSALNTVSARLDEAREVVATAAHAAAQKIVTIDAGDVVADRVQILQVPAEIRRRLLAHGLRWVASADYGPRQSGVSNAIEAIEDKRDFTLHGCLILSDDHRIRICREARAVSDMRAGIDEIWDSRWRADGPSDIEGVMHISALGEDGLKECSTWKETNRPKAALIASPTIWCGSELVAAPHAGLAAGWSVNLSPDVKDFFTSLLSR